MDAYERWKKYYDSNFDILILKIKNGEILCGKYADLARSDKKFKLEGKVTLFSDEEK